MIGITCSSNIVFGAFVVQLYCRNGMKVTENRGCGGRCRELLQIGFTGEQLQGVLSGSVLSSQIAGLE